MTRSRSKTSARRLVAVTSAVYKNSPGLRRFPQTSCPYSPAERESTHESRSRDDAVVAYVLPEHGIPSVQDAHSWFPLFGEFPPHTGVMPAGMFSIDSILSARPSCKEPLLLHRSGPVVLSAGLTDSLYTDYNGLYSATCGPVAPPVQPVSGSRIGYNGYYYSQLHVQGAAAGPPCCGSVPGLSPQQCPCIPTGNTASHRVSQTQLRPTQ